MPVVKRVKLGLSIAISSAMLLSGCGKNPQAKPPSALNPPPPATNPNNNPPPTRGVIVEPAGDDWFTADPELNEAEGMSSNRAIDELQLLHPKKIIVAVIDSGVDTGHEDLKDKIWINEGESGEDENGNDKATNGIDDDGNGYIDDLHGWNFIGGYDENGNAIHIDSETLEITREVVRYEALLSSGAEISEEQKAYYEAVKESFEERVKTTTESLAVLEELKPSVDAAVELIKNKLEIDVLELKPSANAEELGKIETDSEETEQAKQHLIQVATDYRSLGRFYWLIPSRRNSLATYYNKEFNARAEIVKDEPDNFEDTDYGNNDVRGPKDAEGIYSSSSHGTHVAGMIAAKRNNDIGIDGVAENVEIMALRAVPDGDERDKDIALAVRYAVDNGAHIINMSFGKGYSPDKDKVDQAFLYAAEKGVLIVHAAGNAASNNDERPPFPNRYYKVAETDEVGENPTWIAVGASARDKGPEMVASFSNYGKVDVDIFAPGVRTESTVPGNGYASYSGTSMACPAAAGAAALVWSQFESATAVEIKELILSTARTYDDLMVKKPGSNPEDDPVPFSELSKTGGIVDVMAAIKARISQ